MVSYDLLLFMLKSETTTRGKNSMPFLVFGRDYLRSTSGIICRSGFCGSIWGSFAVLYKIRFLALPLTPGGSNFVTDRMSCFYCRFWNCFKIINLFGIFTCGNSKQLVYCWYETLLLSCGKKALIKNCDWIFTQEWMRSHRSVAYVEPCGQLFAQKLLEKISQPRSQGMGTRLKISLKR